MTWRIRISHRSSYCYGHEVESSYNEARITPLTTHRQLVLDAGVHVTPSASILRYWDYWGTQVHAFDLHLPHTELVVTSTAVVETSAPAAAPAAVGWDDVACPGVRDEFAELLAATPFTSLDGELSEVARGIASTAPPAETCDRVVEWVHGRLRYEPGATSVSTSAAEALQHGGGVCQDFAHITLAALRVVGIPARYVSGYLHPDPQAEIGAPIVGESHAWVEAWIGDWHALDPTNGGPVGERHVVVARGRDYADVPPLKGLYHGGPLERLSLAVELTRLA